MAYVPIALAIDNRFKNNDLRVYAWLDTLGIQAGWVHVSQTDIAKDLSADGRIISRKTIMGCLTRMTEAGVLTRSGRLYKAVTDYDIPNPQPGEG